MPDTPVGGPPAVSIEFGALEWEEEVERYGPRSPARVQAQGARRTIEAGTATLDWKRCKADGPGMVATRGSASMGAGCDPLRASADQWQRRRTLRTRWRLRRIGVEEDDGDEIA